MLKLSQLPPRDVLAHVVADRPNNYYDDEINIYFDGVLPGGDVTQGYVDDKVSEGVTEAKDYTDEQLAKVALTKLYTSYGQNTDGAVTQKFFTDKMQETVSEIDDKQDQLISGQTIKTVNGQDILGSGNIEIEGGEPNAITPEEFEELWENA